MSTIAKILIGVGVLGLIALIAVPIIVTRSLGGAREKARDARITSEMGQLRSRAEMTSAKEGGYSKVSCDYNFELESICSDIEDQGGQITIHTSQESYCAYTPLNQSGYYCVDSTGAAGETDTDPSTTCGRESFECP